MGQERNRDRLRDIVNGGSGNRGGVPMFYDLAPWGMDLSILTNNILTDEDLQREADKHFEQHLKSGIYLYCTLRKCLTPEEYIRHETDAREKIRQEYFDIENSDLSAQEKQVRHANIGHHWFRDDD